MDAKREPRRWFLALFLIPTVALAFWVARSWDGHPVAAWWVACNVAVLPFWAYDKWQARRGGWRVPEASLHAMAVVGAAPASLVALEVLRHKTRKPAFRVLYWSLSALQVAAGVWWLTRPAG